MFGFVLIVDTRTTYGGGGDAGGDTVKKKLAWVAVREERTNVFTEYKNTIASRVRKLRVPRSSVC